MRAKYFSCEFTVTFTDNLGYMDQGLKDVNIAKESFQRNDRTNLRLFVIHH